MLFATLSRGETNAQYSGWWRRAGALLVDTLLIAVVRGVHSDTGDYYP